MGVCDNGHSILMSLCAIDNSILGRQITHINSVICPSKPGSCFPLWFGYMDIWMGALRGAP